MLTLSMYVCNWNRIDERCNATPNQINSILEQRRFNIQTLDIFYSFELQANISFSDKSECVILINLLISGFLH